MQLKKTAVLVAIACASIAGQANAALSDSETNTAVISSAAGAGRVFFISGASATQKGLAGIATTLFSSSFRLANTSVSSRDYEAVAGIMKTGPWAGLSAIIIDRVKGGSVFGVNSVARDVNGDGIVEGELIESLSVNTTDCTTGTGTVADPYICLQTNGTTRPHMIPDAGISDVAPDKFQSPINTEGEVAAAALSELELADITNEYSKPLYTLAFGVPVTNNINPKLTRATVAGIMAGNITKWNEVDSTVAAEDIVVCRRVQGSGSQAVDNLYFGNYPCSENLKNEPANRESTDSWNDAANTYVINASSGYQVIENSSSGDVRNCLKAAGEAITADKTYSTKDRSGVRVDVTFKAKAGGHKAIGVLSMDSVGSSNAATATGWSFRSLGGAGTVSCVGTPENTTTGAPATGCPYVTAPVTAGSGIFPTEANLEDGSWDLQGWVSWNVPSRTVANTDKLGVAEAFRIAAQDPAVLDGVPDTNWSALALPAPFSTYSGAGVQKVKYVGGNQCGPLYK